MRLWCLLLLKILYNIERDDLQQFNLLIKSNSDSNCK